ncbi:flagellar brake protein [Azoarcus sp. L1K30]|uniref:flagellar brake protein n=1 Tax=Azoarcus sp. L1K30 TaxID=2820277 RepID=UPI001B842397|nr:flagellar brake protein [Azoarcus sp. L1K30]MBR0564537.1 flagellar brake protein [Azoarcus sp. L1K30]
MSDKTEHPAIEQPQTDNLEQYLLFGRRQIRQLLQDLIDGHSLISAHISPGGVSFLTALITLSDDEEWVFFDVGPNEAINRKAQQAERLICVTQLNKIRIQFSVDSITLMQIDGTPAFAARVPVQMARMQRREFYRLQVPITHQLNCSLRSIGSSETPIEVRVIDISPAGIALQVPEGDASFNVGQILPDCRLALPDTDPVSMRLEVRNVTLQTLRTGIRTQRVGCRFADLPQAADVKIQRYILKTERERSARERGGL